MCRIPVHYGCGHTRLTDAKPCMAALQGKRCEARAVLDTPPIEVPNACLVCTAQAQADAARVQARHAEDQLRAIQRQANVAREKVMKAHDEIRAAQMRVERAKYMGQATIQIEVRQDDHHLAELEERMSRPVLPVENITQVSSTRPRQLEFADVIRALANAEKRKHDQEFAKFRVRFRREKAQKEKKPNRHHAQPPKETSEVKIEQDQRQDHQLDQLIERMRHTIAALDSETRPKSESMTPPPSIDQYPATSTVQMASNTNEEPLTPTTDDYIEFAPQLQILRDVKSEHSRGRPYGMG